MTFNPLFKKTSAWLPIAMSGAAIALLLAHVALFGITADQEDEGTAARIFQFLLAGQLPIIAVFLITSFRGDQKHTARILCLQIAAAFGALVLVAILER